MKLEDILNSEYLETDIPENLIDENQNIKEITKHILAMLDNKGVLKKNFNKKDFINEIYEDIDLLNIVREISDDILLHISTNYGGCEIIQNNEIKNINDIWKFTYEERKELDKENRQYYIKF